MSKLYCNVLNSVNSSKAKLTTQAALKLLIDNRDLIFPTQLKDIPQPGDVYIFTCTDFKDYKVDGYIWEGDTKYVSSYSLNNCSYLVQVNYFYCLPFYKRTFLCSSLSNNVIVYYFGDYVERKAHGNSTFKVPFTRILPSVMEEIKTDVRTSNNVINYHVKAKEKFENLDSLTNFNVNINLPRDSKQFKNIKQQEQKLNLHYSSEFGTYLMGKSICREGYIFEIQSLPDFIGIFADHSAIELANIINDLSNHECVMSSYDTTYDWGPYYLSSLVMRNVLLEGDPIFPVMFLIHEKKYKYAHSKFFSKLVNNITFKASHPILLDREKAHMSAAREAGLNDNLVFCHNHLMRDVKEWLKGKSII